MFDNLKGKIGRSGTRSSKKSTRTMRSSSTGKGSKIANIIHIFYRFVQIVMACVVIGYYGSDLNAAHKVHKYSDSKWVYAVVVGSLSAVTALVLAILGIFFSSRTVVMFFGWEWILVILWSACTGIFGSMYRTENPEMDKGVQDMKTAFYFDCVNLALWGLSAIIATAMFFGVRRGRSLHTGRAKT